MPTPTAAAGRPQPPIPNRPAESSARTEMLPPAVTEPSIIALVPPGIGVASALWVGLPVGALVEIELFASEVWPLIRLLVLVSTEFVPPLDDPLRID